jgi:hypothetical protein
VTTVSPATAWYVYGVVDAGAARLERELATTPGVGTDAGIRVVEDGTIGAVSGSVPLGEFGEDALRERLNDPAWLEEKVRAHEEVLQRVLGETAVVPLRFGTIYHDLDDVVELLRQRRAEFEAALAHVRGRVELGVKGWADRARVADAVEPAEPTAADAPPSGRAYLERRQDEQRRARAAADAIAEATQEAHGRLAALAVDAVRNRPQPRELTGRDDEMILNSAYLVASGDTSLVDEVAALNASYGRLGLAFEATGPWPPHNFVESGADPT